MYYGQDSPLVGTDFDVQFMLVKAGQVLEVQKEGNLTYTQYGHMRWAVGSKTTMLPSGCYIALNTGEKLRVDVYAENTGSQARYCSCDITLFYY